MPVDRRLIEHNESAFGSNRENREPLHPRTFILEELERQGSAEWLAALRGYVDRVLRDVQRHAATGATDDPFVFAFHDRGTTTKAGPANRAMPEKADATVPAPETERRNHTCDRKDDEDDRAPEEDRVRHHPTRWRVGAPAITLSRIGFNVSPLGRCANCLAPLRLDLGPVATCAYCRAQTPVAAAPSTVERSTAAIRRRVAAEIAFVVSPTLRIPVIEANTSVPIARTEMLSTSRDGQEALEVSLFEGSRALVGFWFPIRQRAPRGVPKIGLTVRIAETGALGLTVSEPGTENVVDRDGLSVTVNDD